MRISFSPVRRDGPPLELEKSAGDRLRVNGELFNFNPLNEGDTIPAGIIPCDGIVGGVERVEGEIRVTVVLPHGPNPSAAVAFPEPVVVTEDGPIPVPQGSDPSPPSPRVRTDEEYDHEWTPDPSVIVTARMKAEKTPTPEAKNIQQAPADLFGGPTIKELFDAN